LPAFGRYEGERVTVLDDGDGREAEYSWRSSSGWTKIADPDNVSVEITYPLVYDLSSEVDGIKTIFNLDSIPIPQTLIVYVCGLAMREASALLGGDFSRTGSVLTFYSPPPANVNMLASFVSA